MAGNAAPGAEASPADLPDAPVGPSTPTLASHVPPGPPGAPHVPPAPPGAPHVPPGPPGSTDRRRRNWRWAARGIALVALAITVMMIALGVGMRANDNAIDDHLGTATATVLSISPLRTGIEFVDATGTTIRPEGGVLYPGLLSLGQQFVVQYSTQDPQIVRVAGRTAGVGTTVIVLTLAVTYLIAVPLIWWCLRRSGRPLLRLRRGPGHAADTESRRRQRPHRPAR